MNLADRDSKIDVLRGIAVLGILLIHTQNAWYLGVGGDLLADEPLHLRDHWLGILSISVIFGILGMNLFFYLSRFCIHLWRLRRKNSSGEFEKLKS